MLCLCVLQTRHGIRIDSFIKLDSWVSQYHITEQYWLICDYSWTFFSFGQFPYLFSIYTIQSMMIIGEAILVYKRLCRRLQINIFLFQNYAATESHEALIRFSKYSQQTPWNCGNKIRSIVSYQPQLRFFLLTCAPGCSAPAVTQCVWGRR